MRVTRWDTPAAFFPWPHVQAEVDAIEVIVYGHAMAAAQAEFGDRARPCPGCGKASDRLCWLGVQDPVEAWERGEGRSGFLTICPDCRLQVDFFTDDELTRLAAATYAPTGGLP